MKQLSQDFLPKPVEQQSLTIITTEEDIQSMKCNIAREGFNTLLTMKLAEAVQSRFLDGNQFKILTTKAWTGISNSKISKAYANSSKLPVRVLRQKS